MATLSPLFMATPGCAPLLHSPFQSASWMYETAAWARLSPLAVVAGDGGQLGWVAAPHRRRAASGRGDPHVGGQTGDRSRAPVLDGLANRPILIKRTAYESYGFARLESAGCTA
jgi:hypothetical protein